MSWDEFEIIRRCFARETADSDVLLGIGDDAAVVDMHGPVAVAVDTLVAGVHFPDAMPPEAIGHRVLAVNLSDLAAMGASPRWCTLALTIPDPAERWLEAFAGGFFELAERHGLSLLGGDLTRGPLAATVQVLGPVQGKQWLTRGGAHPGDDIYVTGSLGDGAAGLALFKERATEGAEHRALVGRFLRPTPRVEEGRALASLASAAIDVSDGLLADLAHVCEASGCSAAIDVERLPLSGEILSLFPPQVAEAYALAGGDDYELCFTAAPAQAEAVETAMERLGTPARRIGRMDEGAGVVCRRGGEPFTPAARGFLHF